MEADRARAQEPAVGDSSPEAMESNPVFAPDRLGRTVLLVKYRASRLNAAMIPPCSSENRLILSNHDTVTTAAVSEKYSRSGGGFHTK